MKLKIGKEYGSWKVIGPHKKIKKKPKGFRHLVLCKCVCGKEKFVPCSALNRGKTKSCGCQRRNRVTHGMSGTSEYRSWLRMKQRCYDPKSTRFEDWGGRGVQVCERWKHSFENFIDDMGTKPDSRFSIERIDNNGDYTPANCRWASPKEQARNSRKNRHLTHNGITLTLVEWSELTGIKHTTITQRIDKYGWSIDNALTIPVDKH